MCCGHLVVEMAWQVSSSPDVPIVSYVAGACFQSGSEGTERAEVGGCRAALASPEHTPVLTTLCGDHTSATDHACRSRLKPPFSMSQRGEVTSLLAAGPSFPSPNGDGKFRFCMVV